MTSPFVTSAARRRSLGVPTTPASRFAASLSTPSSPSLSATRPFDWDAARNLRPPPYATPTQKSSRNRRSIAAGGLHDDIGTPRTTRQRFVRRQSWVDRIKNFPSSIAFQISLFPSNVPLPPPLLSGRIIAAALHFIHFIIRYRALQGYKDEDLGWEDMKTEMDGFPSILDDDNDTWGFNWSTPLSFLLFASSVLNTVYLFTRFKLYQLHLRTGKSDLPASPHASFVPSTLSKQASVNSLWWQLIQTGFSAIVHIWRFLLNIAPPLPSEPSHRSRESQIQQLDVWSPGEAELAVFSIYSPVHALLWSIVNPGNWILALIVMILTSVQIHGLIRAYTTLLKDRAIIAAEVMYEYDSKFVFPRILPVRKDASVMTHQAEIVEERTWR